MSDKQLSGITDATLPLGGSEEVHCVQVGNSRVFTVNDILNMGAVRFDGAQTFSETEQQQVCDNLGLKKVKEYVSPSQVITSGGLLSLTHNLGVEPTDFVVILECTSAEFGISSGEKIVINVNLSGDSGDRGVVISPNSTTLEIKYGSASTCFSSIKFSNGNTGNLSNGKWLVKFIARAFV